MNYLLVIFYSIMFYFIIYFLSIKYIHSFNHRIVRDSLYYLTEADVLSEKEEITILQKLNMKLAKEKSKQVDFKTFLLSPFKTKNNFIKLLFSSLLFFCFLICNGFFFFNNLSLKNDSSISTEEKTTIFQQIFSFDFNYTFQVVMDFLTTKTINEYLFLIYILITFFIFIVDRKSKWLTDESNFFLFLLAIIYMFYNSDVRIYLAFALIPLILLFIPIKLGQGDIFLLSNLTIFLGKDVLFVAFLATFIGFFIVFIEILFLKITRKSKVSALIRLTFSQEIPYGPNLILASYCILILHLYYQFSFFDLLV